jgi:competence protein ComEA
VRRREFLGAAIAAAVIAAGRLVRRHLILDADGAWREPGWLAAQLPPLPAPAPPRRRASARRPAAPLDPNTCPADSLELLPGVGPTIAERIVAARARGVHFARARDMQVVRGIGPRTVEALEPYLVFDAGDSTAAASGQSASADAR